jgi:hypothetical protein
MTTENQSAEQIAEVSRLVAETHTLIATASPAKLASMKVALAAIIGGKLAKDMSPEEYKAARADLVKVKRQ